MKILELSIILLLSFLTYQDFRYRKVSWWLFPLIALAIISHNLIKNDFHFLLLNGLFNMLLLTIQVGFLFIYFAVKYKKLTNIINRVIGIGDVIFMYILTAAFSFPNFAVFLSLSLLMTLIFFLIYRKVSSDNSATVPLAGAFAIGLIMLYIISAVFHKDFFYAEFLTPYL